MRALRLRPVSSAALAVITAVVITAVEIVAVVLSWGREPAWDTLVYGANTLVLASVGALVAARQPRNPIGWLILGAAVVSACFADLAQGWALRGWPGADLAETFANTSVTPQAAATVVCFLLFPSGTLMSPRWRVVGAAGVIGAVLAVPTFVLAPEAGSYFVDGVNPYAADGSLWWGLYVSATAVLLGSFVLSVVALGLRFRRSVGDERQQMKWLALAAGIAAVVMPVGALLWNTVPSVRIAVAVAAALMPVAMGAGILRYRLYDIDLAISGTVVYGTITALLAGTYALVAVTVGAVGGRGSIWATAVVTLVAGFGARPLRDRLQRVVDRRFNRSQYEATERVNTFLEELRAGRAAPEGIEQVLRDAVGDPTLALGFRLPGATGNVDLNGDAVPEPPEHLPIRLYGEDVGIVTVGSASARALLPELLATGGLALEIVRLRVELRRQLDEVAASRARIALAADDERRRIERDLHDGHQQRLVSIGLSLRHAQHALRGTAPDAHALIQRAVDEITQSIEELRELARGLRPTQLDAGLTPALRDLARRAPLPVEVHGSSGRFPTEIEAAAYFTACEGVTNAVKHSGASQVTLRTTCDGTTLVLLVTDNGVGGAAPGAGTGLTGIRDRVAAHGGTLEITSPRGQGTTLTAVFSCAS
ncbi:sensor histidine kinase [Nocardioides sp. NPDC051685]|uniref:sensor histidine kinase n=1 Tax=Nocardioides sp. NPDC051685 TaxID=3364334 RepID=UPI0037972A1B